jgi:hypothetical protein
MGVLTDFVVADAADAQRVCDSDNPGREFDGIDAKGIDQVKMGTLYAILTDAEYDPSFMTSEESFLCSASDDGPWVQLVPQDMVDRLARIADVDMDRVAEKWFQTEEFSSKYSGWSPNDVRTFLVDMPNSRAKHAPRENQY